MFLITHKTDINNNHIRNKPTSTLELAAKRKIQISSKTNKQEIQRYKTEI